MPIVLLLQMMGGWDRWGVVDLCHGVTGVGYNLIAFVVVVFCAFVFCCLMFLVPLFRWLEHDGCCVFLCFFFIFFVSGPFN